MHNNCDHLHCDVCTIEGQKKIKNHKNKTPHKQQPTTFPMVALSESQQLVSFSWSLLCSQKKQLQHILQPLHTHSYNFPDRSGKAHGVAHQKSWAILKLLFIFQTVQMPHPTNHTFGWALVPTQRMQQKCSFHSQHTIRAATPTGKLQHEKQNYPGVKWCTKACWCDKGPIKGVEKLKNATQHLNILSTMYKQLRLSCSAVKWSANP